MPKGYRLPENLNPTDNCYIIVSVPNEERYRHAFFGAYEWLGYWFAWERDTQRRGKDAASRWRTSVLETLELYEEIGCMSPLTINVNCDGGSQCCTFPTVNVDVTVSIGQAAYDEIVALPGTSIDDGQTPPDGFATYQDYLDAKCAYANKYALDLRDSWEALSNIGLAAATLSIAEMIAIVSVSGTTSWAVGLIGAGITATAVGPALIAGLVFLGTGVGAAAYSYFNNVLAEWTHDEIVCAVYGAESAADARTRLIGVMGSWAVDAGLAQSAIGGKFINWLVQWLNTLLTERSLFAAFDSTNYITTLPTFDCSTCALIAPPPPDLGGLEDGLLYYFELEEESGDRNSSHTTPFALVSNAMAKGLNGITGLSDYFNGSTSRLGNTVGRQFLPVNSSFSMAVWFNPTTYPASNGYMFHWGNVQAITRRRFHLRLTSTGNVSFQVTDSSGGGAIATYAGQIPLNTWHLAVCTYDFVTGQIKLHIDNQEPNTSQAPNPMNYATEAVTFGLSANGNSYSLGFNGYLDEVGVWTRVLTDDELDLVWNAGFGISYQNIVGAGNPA